MGVSLRFLWNRLLDAEYAATGRFLWKRELQPIAVGMKRQPGLEWLADLPAHAVLDTVARMDGALRRMVRKRKTGRQCGFPKAKKKFVRESGIRCVGQVTEVGGRDAALPKLGRVKLRGGGVPDGRLLAARVARRRTMDAVGAVRVRPGRADGADQDHGWRRSWGRHAADHVGRDGVR